MSSNDLILENRAIFKDYFLDDSSESISHLPNINAINVIIGSNNSGKSRFIRNLMTYKSYLVINKEYYDEHEKLIDKYFNYLKNSYGSNHISGLKNISSLDLIRNLFDENMAKLSDNIYGHDRSYADSYNYLRKKNFVIDKKLNNYYIPTLRSAHSLFEASNNQKGFKKIEQDIYKETLKKNYPTLENDVEIFTGLDLYEQILDARNSDKKARERFQNFEDFLSNNFFGKRQVDIVAEFKYKENKIGNNESELILIHVEGEKETRKLHDLGDGIQAIIILMYKIFMTEENSFIFIDEPEINLHPGMQRLFLEQIISNEDLKKKNLTYFITTHSNHFLDLTIEKDNVSIYSFSPRLLVKGEKQFVIKNVNAGENEILRNLGVNNSSVFMANCSIWVEGVSDRNYIKAFLKSYCESEKKIYPKEDIDFAFFEYAGSNIDHYVFDKEFEKEDEKIVLNDIASLALSNRIFLLADSDCTKLSSKKGKRLKVLEDAKTDNFVPKILWDLREVENLITNDIWKEILINLCNKTLIKSHKDEIIKKIEAALSEINSLDFQKKYIGEFLEELRNKIGKISTKYILNQSTYEVKNESFGTIINKREVSELVFDKNFSWEVLSKNEEIKNLTIEIYDFIMNK